MLQRVLQVHSRPQGETIEGVRRNEAISKMRPGGRLLVADFRRSRFHPVIGRATRHSSVDPLEDLATTAGFYVEASGDLPLLRYIQAVRPKRGV